MIAGASNNEERLSEKLFYLLTDTFHCPLSETAASLRHLSGRYYRAMRRDRPTESADSGRPEDLCRFRHRRYRVPIFSVEDRGLLFLK